ncbi:MULTISPECIES: TetR/AcrR family transcriptional regulator [unclassified Polaribacter]|jgi:AcrR family transcriptional regulator|uniref:TetR/AcrR family transcriptional regulator n=1 Tax=unclassified Polaribacter TaxID=196858 RepID=UPI00055FC3E5|nr:MULTISPECIES: TetR/AcrR family transcriptional regulator [unclassified Polaribacter]MBT3741200.1 TetR/AcrR family transcriptional regulator [Polaribacter sp.]MBT4413413.1 TetR/AcrR family transcriptional regulator [Polaribacter sp.]MBT7816963.1 TetR/AcrR family transcriptional regulator [Polaribacter sp.]MDG2436399.1 TetR/AcrR family transcriptional regulator [Polaribacter sp.]PKV66181.1 TetR family transcriptional regulator [Polaribacter sp. Hel1_33_96]
MRNKILEKSNELFLNLGFKSVTMDEIASSLGVSKKTLYKYFSNKTALIDAVTEYMFNTICCSIDTICAQELNPIDELFHIKRVVTEHLKDEKSSPLYQLQKYYPEIYTSLKQKQLLIMRTTIQDNLERGVQLGLFRSSIDVDFISRIYFSGILGIKDQQIFPLKKYSMNTLTSLYLEYHLRGIITDKGVKILENQLKLK